jgi:pimeloyl-ACP methyl ester carboxylesterase
MILFRCWIGLLLFVLTLAVPGLGDRLGPTTLRIEFAQEGEPSQPRALILIHDALQSRESLSTLLRLWGERDRSWARDQYCSVYSYEYQNSGLESLPTAAALAEDLYLKIRSDRFRRPYPDKVNPRVRPVPVNPPQPSPSLRSKKTELLLAGYGYGGLVARELSLLAKEDGLKVTRVAYVGTPLDGLSTLDLLLALSVPSRASKLGLPGPIGEDEFLNLSEGWQGLFTLYERASQLRRRFVPVLTETVFFGCYGNHKRPTHPTDNVLYGRHRRLADITQSGDGLSPLPMNWGERTGPIDWVVQSHLEKVHHQSLAFESADFILTELVDRKVTYDYLWRRQQIEDYVRGDGEILPLYIYWDERDTKYVAPQWREAYASRKGLYEMMWY